MSVTEVVARNDYTGNGSLAGPYTYAFRILAKADLEVLLDGVTKVVDTDYTVAGVGADAGGSVTFTVAPASGVRITLLRKQPASQLSDYVLNEDHPSGRLETDFDKLVMALQQDRETLGRTLRATKAEALDMLLPAVASRKSNVLGFDSLGKPTAVPLPTAGGGDVSLATVQATGGTVLRTLAERFAEVINVKDKGAVGDGITDDTAAIQAAIDAVSDGGAVFLPWATAYYKITTTLTIAKSLRLFGPSFGLGHASIRSDAAIDLITINAGVDNKIVQIESLYLHGGQNGLNYTWTGYLNRLSYIRDVRCQNQTNAAIKTVTGMIGCEHGPLEIEGGNTTDYGIWAEGNGIFNATAFRKLRVSETTVAAVHLRAPTTTMGPVDFYSPILEANYGKGFELDAVQVNLFNPYFENNGRAGDGGATLYADIELTNNASGNYTKVEHFGGYYNSPNVNQANRRITVLANRFLVNCYGTRLQATDVINGGGFGSDEQSTVGLVATLTRPTVQNLHAKAGTYALDQRGLALRISTFTNGDTTPSVAAGNIFKTSNGSPTTITTFDDGVVGLDLIIIFTDANTTIAETGNIRLSAAFTSSADDTMRLVYDGTNFYEVSRSVN